MTDYGVQIPTNGRVNCPSNSQYNFGSDDFSVTMLVKTNGVGCLMNRQSGKNSAGFSLSISENGVITFTTSNDGGYYETFTDDSVISDGYWHHVAAVRQSGQLMIYIDRIQSQVGIGGGASTPVDVSNTIPILMGDDATGAAPFDGLLEDVTIWNKALTPKELIPTEYNLLTGTEPGLVGYWPMDGNLDDGSATGNNGAGTNVAFVQIFHCNCAYGANDYSFSSITNDVTPENRALGEIAGKSTGTAPVSRSALFTVADGAPALMAAIVTSMTDMSFPTGAKMIITDPNGTVYNHAQNDQKAFVQMDGNSVCYFAILNPTPGSWIVSVTAPGNTPFQSIMQSVPSASIPDTMEDILLPIYGPSDDLTMAKRHASELMSVQTVDSLGLSGWGWVGVAALTVGLGAVTIVTLGATAPVLAGTLAAVAATNTAIVIAASNSLPSDPSADQIISVGANMAQADTTAKSVIFADANSDSATKFLCKARQESYGSITAQASFQRLRLRGNEDKRNSQAFIAKNVIKMLEESGVCYMTCSAHGQNSYLVGADSNDVLRVGSYPAAAVNGKMFHFLACRTGLTLGLDLVRNGAKAFFGYTQPYQMMTSEKLSEGFIGCDSVIDLSLTEGDTAGAAQQKAISRFESTIASWEAAGEHTAAVALQQNLDVFVGPQNPGYGNVNTKL